MKKIILTLALVSSLAFAASAEAARKYGSAGCGLGSMLFNTQPGFSQVFASTTNGTSGNQTFGISSGTSNCTDGGTLAANKAVPAYIEANREALATDAARGNGETLIGLSHVLGCNDAFTGSVQKNYSKIFSDANASSAEVTTSLMNVIKSDSSVSCRHVI